MPRSALTPHPPKLHGMGDVNELLARRVAEAKARAEAVLDEVTVVPPSRYATVDTTTGEIIPSREMVNDSSPEVATTITSSADSSVDRASSKAGDAAGEREVAGSNPALCGATVRVDGVGEERCTSLPTGRSGSDDSVGDVMPVKPASSAPLVDGVGGEATPSSSGSACPASPPALLEWLSPRKNPNGSGQQTSRCGKYIIRKTIQQQRLLYWCWYQASGETRPKLLGYPPTKELAYARCQEHVSEGLQTP
jgi:hypothetical protein